MNITQNNWNKMLTAGVFKFCFLKPFLVGIYTFGFCIVLIIAMHMFSYGFNNTLNAFQIQWNSPGVIILITLCILTSISGIIKNCYLWKKHSDKYSKKSM